MFCKLGRSRAESLCADVESGRDGHVRCWGERFATGHRGLHLPHLQVRFDDCFVFCVLVGLVWCSRVGAAQERVTSQFEVALQELWQKDVVKASSRAQFWLATIANGDPFYFAKVSFCFGFFCDSKSMWPGSRWDFPTATLLISMARTKNIHPAKPFSS